VAVAVIASSAARTALARTARSSSAVPAVLGSAPDRRGCEQRTYRDPEDGRISDIDVLPSGRHSCVPVARPARGLPLDEGDLR
jgi:hypothetical protein